MASPLNRFHVYVLISLVTCIADGKQNLFNSSLDSGVSLIQTKAAAWTSPANDGAVDQFNENRKTGRKNVLFIVVDDLRPNLGAYNFTLGHTPNMDKLAAEGLTFTRSYVQYPFCAPSRNSFMTGRRPDTTRAWNFIDDFRQKGIGEEWATLPEYFKTHGYLTLGSGKLFHDQLPLNYDAPRSWSHEIPYFTELMGATEEFKGCVIQEPPEDSAPTFCALNISADEPNRRHQLPDQKTRLSCISNLHVAHASGRNFFVGCGFAKPHTPWEMPLEFYEMIPEDVPLAAHQTFTEAMPHIAWHFPADVHGMKGKNPLQTFPDREEEYLARSKIYRRAYYAAVAYVDDNIGKVIKALDDLGHKDDTVVIVFGDHGWHLGERNLWGKYSNFDLDLRIPTIMRAPWMQSSNGQVTDVLAEAVDFFPTLADLAGLPDPTSQGEKHIAGVSLAPVFENPSATSMKTAAFSQLAKQSRDKPFVHWPIPARPEIGVMGYSVRVDGWRYSVWFEFDGKSEKPKTDEIIGRELYSHADDDGSCDFAGENRNLVEQKTEKADELHQMILQYIDDHTVHPHSS